jgi:hypothetical protein
MGLQIKFNPRRAVILFSIQVCNDHYSISLLYIAIVDVFSDVIHAAQGDIILIFYA